MNNSAEAIAQGRPLGFWACWSLTVGVMVGSGIFLLPAVLAPYGLMGFGGWLLTGAGSILLALTLGRLAARTNRTGGPYIFAYDAFGGLTGFLVAWGYWASYWTGIPAVAIAFAGYLAVFVPALAQQPMLQCLAALALIWTFTFINIRGVRESGLVQLVMTVLKLAPLLVIVAFGFAAGDVGNLPAFNPSGDAPVSILATTALLTMWAFTGLECGAIPAGSVARAEHVIPRAIVIGTVSVTLLYLAATFAVMMLVPADTLAHSSAPFADAARAMGSWGPGLIAAGALVATAGTLNGLVFVAGQIPMAVARDRLAPALLARRNRGDAPYASLLIAATLSSVLLLANYTRGFIKAFEFLLIMSTVTVLAPLLVSAAAELRHSWRSARGWAGVAALAGAYSVFAIIGSGLEVVFWGLVLVVVGVPLHFFIQRSQQTQRARP